MGLFVCDARHCKSVNMRNRNTGLILWQVTREIVFHSAMQHCVQLFKDLIIFFSYLFHGFTSASTTITDTGEQSKGIWAQYMLDSTGNQRSDLCKRSQLPGLLVTHVRVVNVTNDVHYVLFESLFQLSLWLICSGLCIDSMIYASRSTNIFIWTYVSVSAYSFDVKIRLHQRSRYIPRLFPCPIVCCKRYFKARKSHDGEKAQNCKDYKAKAFVLASFS